MHKRSFGTRGGSIVGAVLVVALLSAAVIALESQDVSPTAMLAQATAPKTTSNPAEIPMPVAVQNPTQLTTTCEIGYDYVIRVNKNNETTVTAAKNDAKGRPTVGASTKAEASRCPTLSQLANDGSGRVCSKAQWECRVTYCQPKVAAAPIVLTADANQTKTNPPEADVNQANTQAQEVCMLISKRSKVDEEIKPSEKKKEAYEEAGKQAADPALTPEEQKAGEDFLRGGTLQDSDGILKGWEQAQRDTDLELQIQQDKVAKAAAERDALLASYERSNCGDADRFVVYDLADCKQQGEDLNAANQKVLDEQKRLGELQKHSERLAGLEKTLAPSLRGTEREPQEQSTTCLGYPGVSAKDCPTVTEKDLSTFGRGDPNNKPPCQGIGCWLDKQSGYPDQRDALTAACQAGNQGACMQLYGGQGGPGASGGLGGARPSGGSSGGCGPSQQGGMGGLIGMALSLFLKSSSSGSQGCTNGVPNPSCTITASPTNVAAGQPVTLTWQSEQAFSATLSSSGSVAPQGSMTVNPQTTTTYTLSLNGYVDSRSGQQLRGQCAVQVTVGGQGGGDGAPKAEISCRPEIADVGMSVALSYACRNSATSGGSGFETNNQLSGSATPVIESPTIGSNVVKYGLTCSKEGKTDTAECTVQVNKPTIVLIANPKDVQSGGEANIGWVTGGMEECTISSPTLSGFTAENAGNTSTSGVAKTPPLTDDAEFVLSCTTKAGATKTAETTVTIR